MMTTSVANEKKWLVKSENKILGPFSIEQIKDLIFKKQISIIDEVRDSETRWLYLRENLHFKHIVDEIRIQLDMKGESTKTFQNSISLSTKATDEATSATRSNAQYFTDVSLPTQEASVVKETVDQIVTRTRASGVSDSAHTSSAPKYVFRNDPATEEKVGFFSKNLKVATLIIFIISVSGVFSFYFYNKYNQQRLESEIITQVKKLKFLGLGKQAAVQYAKLAPAAQKKYFSEVPDLFPFIESLGFQLKNLDEVESSANITIENKVNVFLARFGVYMQAQNFELAQNEIIKAKTLQPADILINENEALLNLRNKKYLIAIDSFIKLYQQNNFGRYLIGAAQAFQGLSPQDRTKFQAALESMTDRHIAIRFDYRKELLLLQMAFAKIKNNDILFNLSWKHFLNTPTQLASLFKKPTLLYLRAYQWKDLEYFSTIVRKALSTEEDIVFQIHQYLESGQVSSAVDFSEKNKNAINDNLLKHQTALLIYYALNKKNEILSFYKTNQLDKSSELNHILVGLAKASADPFSDLTEHIDFLNQKKLKFYADWIILTSLIQKKSMDEINNFIKSNIAMDSEFILVQEARGMLD